MTSRTAVAAGIVLTLSALLAGCGGSDDAVSTGTTSEVLALAKKQFDEAASVRLELATTSVPSSGDAVLGASGVLTHQPAFEGEVKVILGGFNADVPIVSVDDTVYAKLPLTTAFAPIDPSEYGAPDPADFADLEGGISALLLELEDAEKSGQKRDGDQVLTTYTGTLSGSFVKPIIPSAGAQSSYRTVVGIDSDGRLITLAVTGDFFEADGEVTYDLVFEAYGEDVTITAP